MSMAHSIIIPVPATAITPIAKSNKLISHIPSLRFQTVSASNQTPNHVLEDKLVHRRAVTLSLAGAMLGLNVGDRSEANAAARRPPPPPPKEKKDPSVNGVLAKVLASKKRKEAMKESIAKLREKGKPVNGSVAKLKEEEKPVDSSPPPPEQEKPVDSSPPPPPPPPPAE